MTPWLSVIMPIHGGVTYLAATLDSVAAEVACHPEWGQSGGVEVRLYNSADDAGAAQAVAQRYADRLDLIWQDDFATPAWPAKTNRGVAEARAPHVAMLHQDDLWRPGHLVALRAALAAAPLAVMSIAPSVFVGPGGNALGDWRLPFPPGLIDGRRFAATLLVQNSIAIPSPLILREAWLACGGLDPALWYTADWDLYLKLAGHGAVYVRAAPTTAFRVHGQSLTITGSRDGAAFGRQLEIVLDRHMPALAPLPRGIAARAQAGVAINRALAEAANGRRRALLRAGWRLAKLGPVGAVRFLGEARLFDRLRPRLMLGLAAAAPL